MSPFEVSSFRSFKHALKSLLVTSPELWKSWLEGFQLSTFNCNDSAQFTLNSPSPSPYATDSSTWQLIGSFFLVSHPAGFLMSWDTYHIFYNVQGPRSENTSQGQLPLATASSVFSLSFCLHFIQFYISNQQETRINHKCIVKIIFLGQNSQHLQNQDLFSCNFLLLSQTYSRRMCTVLQCTSLMHCLYLLY